MAERLAPWLEDILRAAGDISAATAAKIQQAAEDTYQQSDRRRGEAWAHYNARQTAKSLLTAVATDSDPAVQGAFQRYQEARTRADRLYAAAAVDRTDSASAAWMDADVADHQAKVLWEKYDETWTAAWPQHDAEVRKAWRGPDREFVRSHRKELEWADPARFKSITSVHRLAQASFPVAPSKAGSPPARTSRRPPRHVPRHARRRRR
jgi:hypothetical protein